MNNKVKLTCETSQDHTVRYTVCISSTVNTHFIERIIGSVTVDTHIIKNIYITVYIFFIFLGVYRTVQYKTTDIQAYTVHVYRYNSYCVPWRVPLQTAFRTQQPIDKARLYYRQL